MNKIVICGDSLHNDRTLPRHSDARHLRDF